VQTARGLTAAGAGGARQPSPDGDLELTGQAVQVLLGLKPVVTL
jgi:hypothetical protein